MGKRVYGQYCGFARALELVCERWTLMIVRDLLVSPKRFTDLQRGLPKIPTNILSSRLKEMEVAGIVRRRLVSEPNAVVYEMTEAGAALEPAIMELGRWGAKRLGAPRNGEIVTVDALVTALRATFQRKTAKGVTLCYELRMGDIVLHARIVRGKLSATPGPAFKPDLTIEMGPAFRDLLAGELPPRVAVAQGLVMLRGPDELFDRFVDLFKI